MWWKVLTVGLSPPRQTGCNSGDSIISSIGFAQALGVTAVLVESFDGSSLLSDMLVDLLKGLGHGGRIDGG
jgi:hypothetical protein